MIGTIRKHSKWLWIIIAGLTIISFVVFMGSGPVNKGGGGGSQSGGNGTLYGKPITAVDFARAQAEFYIYYWMHYNQWPNQAGVSSQDMARDIYIRLMIAKKAEKMGIVVGEESQALATVEFLKSLGRNGQEVKIQQFVQQILAPARLTATDLQNFFHTELAIQQMIQTMGLSGALVTPQEAGMIYDREHQEVSAQAVFFAASNYLSQVSLTPAAVAQFYTNNMAAYRQPDRAMVSYVFFNVTNFLAQSKAEWEKTNFTEVVESAYRQNGQTMFADAKSPDEAKGKIRDLLIRNRAMVAANKAANDFTAALFAVTPVKPENLAAVAKQQGLEARTTAPFAANNGPAEINVPASFVTEAFKLSADEPFAGPLGAADGVYVIAQAGLLPSSIPALGQILPRVQQDYQEQTAINLAQLAGMTFYQTLTNQMATGSSFAKAAIAAGQTPLALPAFSLSTTELTAIGDHASLGQVKQAAFTTPVGRVSNFMADNDGGFVLFVQEMLPVDQTKKTAAMPQFEAQVRRARQSEAFNLWLMGEANRELKATPVYAELTGTKSRKP
jgi:hypothetical protein